MSCPNCQPLIGPLWALHELPLGCPNSWLHMWLRGGVRQGAPPLRQKKNNNVIFLLSDTHGLPMSCLWSAPIVSRPWIPDEHSMSTIDSPSSQILMSCLWVAPSVRCPCSLWSVHELPIGRPNKWLPMWLWGGPRQGATPPKRNIYIYIYIYISLFPWVRYLPATYELPMSCPFYQPPMVPDAHSMSYL